MARTLSYHPRVSEDLKKINPPMRIRIQHAIETRLAVDPERYGVPLAGSLRGYSKLRVGDYRVVFRLSAGDVRVLAIVHRKDAYERAERRLDR